MIASASNAQIKNLMQLIRKPKARREQGVFIVEGIKMFIETPANRIEKIYVSEKFISNPSNLEKLDGFSYETVKDEVFRRISDTVTPQGVMTIVKKSETCLKNMFSNERNNLFIVLEDLQDPGNLGTIIRTAEGAGVSGVIMSKNTVDIYNPKVIRSTMGAIYRVPFTYVENLSDSLDELKQRGVAVAAAHLAGENEYFEEDWRRNTAFIIGNEANGISDEISKKADLLVRIPMEGKVESLNASVAASILMYEAVRQRHHRDLI